MNEREYELEASLRCLSLGIDPLEAVRMASTITEMQSERGLFDEPAPTARTWIWEGTFTGTGEDVGPVDPAPHPLSQWAASEDTKRAERLMEIAKAKLTESELRDEVGRLRKEIDQLRIDLHHNKKERRLACDERDAAKALLREMAEYFARARPPIGTPTRWYIDRDKLIDRAKEMTDD